jgi:hypothetical protein
MPIKKKAEALQQEISRRSRTAAGADLPRTAKDRWLGFRSRGDGASFRDAPTGASVSTQLLEFDPPGPDQRQLPCDCGYAAKYLGLRSKPVLTAVGEAPCLRPYYWCKHCHQGQFPVDVDLDIEGTELSPGVRRMMAAVGREAAFAQGREQLRLLAG